MNPVINDYPTIVTRFGFAPVAPAVWLDDRQTGLVCRDLSLGQASQGALTGKHFRAAPFARTIDTLIDPGAVFAFLFVLAGKVTLTDSGAQAIELRALDCATRHGAGTASLLEFSHDAEIVLLASTKSGLPLFGSGSGKWVLCLEREEDYLQGNGVRKYFRYRSLEVDNATQRRVQIQIVRSIGSIPDAGTGWHTHGMGQLFYVLRGWADLAVDGQPSVRMSTGDAMCIAKGMAHNVPRFSKDYMVLEMSIPADYETIDAPPPAP